MKRSRNTSSVRKGVFISIMVCVFLVSIIGVSIPNRVYGWGSDHFKMYSDSETYSGHYFIIKKAIEYLRRPEVNLLPNWPLEDYMWNIMYGAYWADFPYDPVGLHCTWCIIPDNCDGLHHFKTGGGIQNDSWPPLSFGHGNGLGAPEYASRLYDLALKFWPGGPPAPTDLRNTDDFPYMDSGGMLTCLGDTRLGPFVVGGHPFLYDTIEDCYDEKAWEECIKVFPGGCPIDYYGTNVWQMYKDKWEKNLTEDDAYGWPGFMGAQFDENICKWTNPEPSESIRSSLIYLGWAIHLVEDLSMPYHAENLHGLGHKGFEDAADTLILSNVFSNLPITPGSQDTYYYNWFPVRPSFFHNDWTIEQFAIQSADLSLAVPIPLDATKYVIQIDLDTAIKMVAGTIYKFFSEIETITPPCSDLIVQSITTYPTTPMANQNVDVFITIKNQGTWGCVFPTSFWVDFYANRESPPGYEDRGGGNISRMISSALQPGATATLIGTIKYPNAGTFKMWAQVDSYRDVKEANEDNNVFGPQTINVVAPLSLVSPTHGATGVLTTPTLDWSDVSVATSYDVQVCNDLLCSGVVRSAKLLNSSWVVTPALDNGTWYWWRVRINNSYGAGSWSDTWSFQTYSPSYSVNVVVSRGDLIFDPVPGVTITFSRVSGTGTVPSACTTDANGSCSRSGFQGLTTYRATPSKANSTFHPSYIDFNSPRTLYFYGGESPPSITLTSPKGGESWAAGTTQTIRWTYKGSPGSSVSIQLLKGGVLVRTLGSISIGTGGSGSCLWSIPSSQAGGSDYQIKVTSTTNSAYTDTSDGNFTITGVPPPSITVTSPNGGENWAAGTTQTINWSYSGSPGSYVKIELFKGGVLNRTIISSRSIGSGGSGSYPWAVPSTQTPGSDYQVKVTSTTNSACKGTSNANFTITGPPSPSIAVTSPKGGESWASGSTQTIQWTYTGNPGSYVKIELLKGGVLNLTISSSSSIGTAGSGSYSWPIPASQAGGSDYQVRVTSTTNNAYMDTSDGNFTITGPVAPSITVTSPNGGENWAAGSTQTISWSYKGSPGSTVKIELLKDGVLYLTLSASRSIGAAGSGSYSWLIRSTLAGGSDYQVRVTSTTNSAYRDTSDGFFTISP